MNWYRIAQLETEVYPGISKPIDRNYLDIGHDTKEGKEKYIWLIDNNWKFHKKEVYEDEGHSSWNEVGSYYSDGVASGRYEVYPDGKEGICSIVIRDSDTINNYKKDYIYKKLTKFFPTGTKFTAFWDNR